MNDIFAIQSDFDLYGSIIPLVALALFIGYFIRNHRKERFEITIVVVMTVKYTLHIVLQIVTRKKIELRKSTQVILYSLNVSTGPIAHWTYAS